MDQIKYEVNIEIGPGVWDSFKRNNIKDAECLWEVLRNGYPNSKIKLVEIKISSSILKQA